MLLNLLTRVDLVGKTINVTHKLNNNVKTGVGGLYTILIIAVVIYSLIYFGRDMIEKKEPKIRFNKNFLNESKFYIKDFPLIVYYKDNLGNPLDLSKFAYPEPVLYSLVYNKSKENYEYVLNELIFEPCDPEKYYGRYKDLITDPNNMIPKKLAWCLNPYKTLLPSGSVINKDDNYIINGYSSFPNTFLSINWFRCDSSRFLKKNLTCESQTNIHDKLTEFNIYISLLDNIIDLDNFENPILPFIQTNVVEASLGSLKSSLYNIKKSQIKTDSGIFLNEENTIEFHQLENIQTDIKFNNEHIFSIKLFSQKTIDTYVRKYIKIQDILACIGGLINFLLSFGQIVLNRYSSKNLSIETANHFISENKNKHRNIKSNIFTQKESPNKSNFTGNVTEKLQINIPPLNLHTINTVSPIAVFKKQTIKNIRNKNNSKDDQIQIEKEKDIIYNLSPTPKINLEKNKIFCDGNKTSRKNVEMNLYDFYRTFCARGKYSAYEYNIISSFAEKSLDYFSIIEHMIKIDYLVDIWERKENKETKKFIKLENLKEYLGLNDNCILNSKNQETKVIVV